MLFLIAEHYGSILSKELELSWKTWEHKKEIQEYVKTLNISTFVESRVALVLLSTFSRLHDFTFRSIWYKNGRTVDLCYISSNINSSFTIQRLLHLLCLFLTCRLGEHSLLSPAARWHPQVTFPSTSARHAALSSRAQHETTAGNVSTWPCTHVITYSCCLIKTVYRQKVNLEKLHIICPYVGCIHMHSWRVLFADRK